jgi:TolB-like protein/Tfp pilus assembly protein PilF
MERKLAAILSADVAGFSRLTALDEEGTLRTLDTYRQVISEFVSEHGGRVFATAGDGFVAEFASPVQAVRCAVAIQRGLHRRNQDLPPDRRLELRIGVNLGDVVASGDDLLGDGVNVAARLQAIAAPAGICISGSIREHLGGKVSFRLAPLGERALKNIPRPVAVCRVDWQAYDPAESGILAGPPALPDKPSIAVLPFVNMGGDPEQEYFADGITEDIITALSRHRWFFVIARNSSFAYKGRSVDVRQVARELGVRYVLEGSVRKAGNRVRVTGQLIDAETGAHLWAERYDRSYEDVFAIQDEVTESVVGAIEPEIVMGESRRAVERPTADSNAYDCCIRGIWHLYRWTSEESREGERWLRRAIEIDPRDARSHMALARLVHGRCHLGWSTNVDADSAEAGSLAEHAVALDDRDPYCHYALALASRLAGRFQAALAAAQRAIDLNPNFALGFVALGWVRIQLGLFAEALDPLLRALRLSPNDPTGFLIMNLIGLARYHLGDYEEAFHFFGRAMAIRRNYPCLVVAIACLARLGRLDEARALMEDIAALEPPDREGYWRVVFGYANPAHRAELYDDLRKAGMKI